MRLPQRRSDGAGPAPARAAELPQPARETSETPSAASCLGPLPVALLLLLLV